MPRSPESSWSPRSLSGALKSSANGRKARASDGPPKMIDFRGSLMNCLRGRWRPSTSLRYAQDERLQGHSPFALSVAKRSPFGRKRCAVLPKRSEAANGERPRGGSIQRRRQMMRDRRALRPRSDRYRRDIRPFNGHAVPGTRRKCRRWRPDPFTALYGGAGQARHGRKSGNPPSRTLASDQHVFRFDGASSRTFTKISMARSSGVSRTAAGLEEALVRANSAIPDWTSERQDVYRGAPEGFPDTQATDRDCPRRLDRGRLWPASHDERAFRGDF